MAIIRNPELRGILVILLIVAVLGGALMAATGKLEQWFGITWLSGPRALDSIIYVSGNSGSADLRIMDTDGANMRPLTSGAHVTSGPAISPRGNRIAFVGMKDFQSQVFAVGGKGGDPVQLTGSTASKSEPGYSPDGKSLSFIAAGKVYVADLNGEGLDPVLPTGEELHTAMLERGNLPAYTRYAWSPDGLGLAGVTRDPQENDSLVYLPELKEKGVNLLAVASSEAGNKALVFVPNAGQQPAALMPVSSGGRLRIKGISFAANKPRLAISLAVDKTAIVLLFDASEGATQPVVAVPGQEIGAPAVSPDGSSIAAPVKPLGENGKPALVVFPAGGGDPQALAEGTFEDLSYSPDGDRILATRVTGKKRNIVVIDSSSGEVTALTRDGASSRPIWTPVSKK